MEGESADASPYPAMFHAADSASSSAQGWFLRLSACRFWALVIVAALAAFAVPIDRWAAVVALAPISVALFVEVLLWAWRPDRQWYQARAVAESLRPDDRRELDKGRNQSARGEATRPGVKEDRPRQ